MDKAVRHVSMIKEQFENFDLDLINAHVCMILSVGSYRFGSLVLPCLENYQRLWTLDLSSFRIKKLSASIGKLIHLRHLDLSDNGEIEGLPNLITKLYNLQTLDLRWCVRLKKLPKNFSNLVNLRVLRLKGCKTLTIEKETWMSKLINLELCIFNVGVIGSSLKQQFEGFKALKMLRGEITIKIHMPSSYVLTIEDNTITEGGYIRDLEHHDTISLEFNHEGWNEGVMDYDEELLGALQPHENMKNVTLCGYKCVRMPRSWAIEDNLSSVLRNLIQLTLFDCGELKYLPSLGNLQNLKELELSLLLNLEYMETSVERLQFFPSLQKLTLTDLPKFKGWGRTGEIGGISDSHLSSSLVFSTLIDLDIRWCNLTFLPECPNVKTLKLLDFNERVRITSNPLKLNEVTTNMPWFDSSVPIESLQSLTKLKILLDMDVESLGNYGRVLGACSSSLRTLEISLCRKLRSISGGLRYLTALERLTLTSLSILDLTNEDEEIEGDVECDGMPWGSLSHTLQYLEIVDCGEMKTFPKWMRKLTSLQKLAVFMCSKELYERCQNRNGEDWPNIQHIPCIYVEIN